MFWSRLAPVLTAAYPWLPPGFQQPAAEILQIFFLIHFAEWRQILTMMMKIYCQLLRTYALPVLS
jgi:hypothetical protein